MKNQALIAVMMLWPMFHLPEANAALPNKDAVMQLGFANKATSVDDPMRLVITVKDPANDKKTIERDVTVTDIPKYVAPTQNAGETNRAYGMRIIAAQEAHSKLKTEKIAQAIDTVLGAGRATVVQSNELSATPASARFWNYLVPGDANFTPIKNGQVTVTGAYKVVYGPSAALQKARNDDIKEAKDYNKKPENRNNQVPVPKPLTNNHTGEIGDGVRIKQGIDIIPQPPSPGAKGRIGTMGYELEREFPGEFSQFGFPMVATGMDADGNSSLFQFGILDTYIATLRPFAGESDEELYLALESLLDANGLPSNGRNVAM